MHKKGNGSTSTQTHIAMIEHIEMENTPIEMCSTRKSRDTKLF